MTAEYDLAEARRRRDEAIARAARRLWGAQALDALHAVARAQARVTSEDVWQELARRGIDPPAEGRAMGPVMRQGARDGTITPTSHFVPATNVRHHCNPMRVYLSNVQEYR